MPIKLLSIYERWTKEKIVLNGFHWWWSIDFWFVSSMPDLSYNNTSISLYQTQKKLMLDADCWYKMRPCQQAASIGIVRSIDGVLWHCGMADLAHETLLAKAKWAFTSRHWRCSNDYQHFIIIYTIKWFFPSPWV